MNKLLEVLKIHRGQDRAITARKLGEILNMDERFVRSQIRGLISEWPIASTNKLPFGYFLIDTLDEAHEYMRSLRARLIEDALRRRDFKRAVAKAFDGNGQMRMF